jgi:hypothetical protein
VTHDNKDKAGPHHDDCQDENGRCRLSFGASLFSSSSDTFGRTSGVACG